MKRKNRKLIQIALIVLDILLIGALGAVFYLEKGREEKTSRIRNRALESVQKMREGEGTESVEELAEEQMIPVPKTISIRGDSFAVPGGDPQTAYPAIVQQLLAEGGSDLRVMDYTLDGQNTLTHLYYAGVPSDEISAFIERNRASEKKEADESELQIGEVGNLNLERKDYDAVPIIFTGYYGGWGGSVFELIEMQKRILATYNQQEYYIIMGNHPYNVEDVSTFDSIMQGFWGSHYLGVTKIAGSSLHTLAGHQQLAERIMRKLEQQGIYIPPEAVGMTAWVGGET